MGGGSINEKLYTLFAVIWIVIDNDILKSNKFNPVELVNFSHVIKTDNSNYYLAGLLRNILETKQCSAANKGEETVLILLWKFYTLKY